jgi:competence protein ComEC
LLTGDIERLAEQDLLTRHRKDLRAAILVVPHHGSKISSNPDFIAAVAPDFALFSVGYRNRFGFPDPTVLQRYRQCQSETLSTAAAGAISFQIGQQVSAPTSYRKAARRYWHTRD